MTSSFLFAFVVQTAALPLANPEDVKSEDAIIKSLYSVISGPAGEKRNWDRFRSLFSPKGTLAAVVKNREGKFVSAVMTPETYISNNSPYFEKNSFFEKETRRKVLRSRKLTLVFSDYESRHNLADKKPFEVGTNSIQMYTDGNRWFIHSVLWQGSE